MNNPPLRELHEIINGLYDALYELDKWYDRKRKKIKERNEDGWPSIQSEL